MLAMRILGGSGRVAVQGLVGAERPQESEASGREGTRRRPVGSEG